MQRTQRVSSSLGPSPSSELHCLAATTAWQVKQFAWLTSSVPGKSIDPELGYDYGEALKAPLSQATVLALRDRLASGNYPRRKVRRLDRALVELSDEGQ